MNSKLILILLPLMVFMACVKDKPQPVTDSSTALSTAKKVFVVNEGGFTTDSAEISVYDPTNNGLIKNYFFRQNNTILGDVAQSMTKINNNYYIVVNNSNKIVVCDQDLKTKRTITGLTSPRYIQQVSNQKAYVSDLYANAISIVDLNSGTKTGSISCHGKTEQMVMLYNKVYVTNTDKNYVYVIDATNNNIVDSIVVGINASSLVIDKNDKLWVLSCGTTSPAIVGKLSKIDPVNNSISWSSNFSIAEKAGMLRINGGKDTLYYINKDGICRMPIIANALPNAYITSTSNIYGFDVHPTRFELYVADALDYVSRSKIYVYNCSTGAAKTNFNAGFISNGFYFE